MRCGAEAEKCLRVEEARIVALEGSKNSKKKNSKDVFKLIYEN